jgi:SAM-dependent methyltransferase
MRTDYPAYQIIGDALAPETRVLDVGCGDGTIAHLLSRTGATIDGIEPVKASAEQAEQKLRYVSRGTLGEALIDPKLGRDYDVVLLLDVLEHFVDPAEALTQASTFLSSVGSLFAMIPNSAHWSFRRKILRGDWSYDRWGLFDRTHLRFFDIRTATALCDNSDLTLLRRACIPAEESKAASLGCRLWPNLFALHFLFEMRASR